MRKSGIVLSLVILWVSFLVFPVSGSPPQGGTPGQEPPLPADRSFGTLRATTRMVVLDVMATDGMGNAITGLKPEDFTLLEDGKEQEISVFQWQRPGASSAKTQIPELPVNVFSNASARPQSGPRNVIVLDAWNDADREQAFARIQIIRYAKTARLNGPVAIFVFAKGGVGMLQDFTTDRAVLLKAARNLQPEPSPAGAFYHQMWGDNAKGLALGEFAGMLAAYPGRTNLIWVAGRYRGLHLPDRSLVLSSFDLSPGPGAAPTPKTVSALVDSQVAIYPVRPATEPVPCGDDDPTMTYSFRGQYPTGRRPSVWALPNSPYETTTDRMDRLARHAGGKAYYGQCDMAVGDAINNGSTYYVLGYYPENKNWNGAFRHIKVKVNRPKVDLRYRRGYVAEDPEGYARKPTKVQARDLQQTLMLNTPVKTGLIFKAEVVLPSSPAQDKVAVQYAIDAQGLDFRHGDDGLESASVDCVAQAFTEDGEVVKASANTYAASLEPESFKQVFQDGFSCSQNLDLLAGNYVLKLAVRDNRTGAIGTVNAKITVPGAE